MKIIKRVIPALAAIFSLSGCGNENPEPVDKAEDISVKQSSSQTELSENMSTAEQELTKNDGTEGMIEPVSKTSETEKSEQMTKGSEFAAPIADITRNLLSAHAASNDCGMISGYSAYSALMYIYPYASGQTLDEMNRLLGQPDAKRFRESQPVRPEKKEGEMEFMGMEPAQFYTSGLFLVDNSLTLNTDDTSDFVFRDLHDESVVSYVNDYVSENTNELIPQMISSPFDKACNSVVLDTIYFKANWADAFNEAATAEDTFYGRDSEASVDFMNKRSFFAVYDDVIRLGYRNTPIVMDIVKDIDDVDSGFEYYQKNCGKLSDTKNQSETILKLPKFTAETSMDLKEALTAMGMPSAFSIEADFSALADELYISDIIQKSKIAVDENGTEAAAVTMISAKLSAPPREPVKPIEFIVNKPFLYILKNTETEEILFAGYYYNF